MFPCWQSLLLEKEVYLFLTFKYNKGNSWSEYGKGASKL